MPYIPKDQREKLRPELDPLMKRIISMIEEFGLNQRPGILNYVFSKILLTTYSNRNYFAFNEMAGILSCVKDELYRIHTGPYEDGAIMRNGDILND